MEKEDNVVNIPLKVKNIDLAGFVMLPITPDQYEVLVNQYMVHLNRKAGLEEGKGYKADYIAVAVARALHHLKAEQVVDGGYIRHGILLSEVVRQISNQMTITLGKLSAERLDAENKPAKETEVLPDDVIGGDVLDKETEPVPTVS